MQRLEKASQPITPATTACANFAGLGAATSPNSERATSFPIVCGREYGSRAVGREVHFKTERQREGRNDERRGGGQEVRRVY